MARKKPMGEMAIFYGDKPNTGQYDNGIWMDVLDIPYIEKIDEAQFYKVIIRTLWLDAIGWSKEIKNRYPHVIQIGLSDHPLSADLSRMNPRQASAYLEDLSYLDGIMALSEEERQWYQIALPSKPVRNISLPFPTHKYEKERDLAKTYKKEWVGLGIGAYGAGQNDRNFISNLLVFRKLKLKYPDLKGVFLSVPEPLIPYCSAYADYFKDVYLHERVNMEDFYEILSGCKFVINLADRNSPGRVQGEGAYFGVPVIGTNRFELQNTLWPKLACSSYELEKAYNLADTLLSDENWHQELCDYAYDELLANYDYAASKAKFDNLLENVKSSLA